MRVKPSQKYQAVMLNPIISEKVILSFIGHGWVAERSNATDCKSTLYEFGGSNPSTTIFVDEYVPLLFRADLLQENDPARLGRMLPETVGKLGARRMDTLALPVEVAANGKYPEFFNEIQQPVMR